MRKNTPPHGSATLPRASPITSLALVAGCWDRTPYIARWGVTTSSPCVAQRLLRSLSRLRPRRPALGWAGHTPGPTRASHGREWLSSPPCRTDPPGNALATWRAFGRAGPHLRERPALPGLRPAERGCIVPCVASLPSNALVAWQDFQVGLAGRRRVSTLKSGSSPRPGLQLVGTGCVLPCVAQLSSADALAT